MKANPRTPDEGVSHAQLAKFSITPPFYKQERQTRQNDGLRWEDLSPQQRFASIKLVKTGYSIAYGIGNIFPGGSSGILALDVYQMTAATHTIRLMNNCENLPVTPQLCQKDGTAYLGSLIVGSDGNAHAELNLSASPDFFLGKTIAIFGRVKNLNSPEIICTVLICGVIEPEP